MSPAASHIIDALTQILTLVIQNKQESNKRLIFDGTDKSKCIDWLIQVEAAAQFMKFMNAPLRNSLKSSRTSNLQCTQRIYPVMPQMRKSSNSSSQTSQMQEQLKLHPG